MATYILRNYSVDLAATGFKCIMLTGSHSAGSSIEDTDADVKGTGTATIDSRYGTADVTIGDSTYHFNNKGVCTSSNNTRFRLMLADNVTDLSIEEALNQIYSTLTSINETQTRICTALGTLNSTIERYCSSINSRLATVNQSIEDIEEDISGLATQSDLDALEERVRALEEEN